MNAIVGVPLSEAVDRAIMSLVTAEHSPLGAMVCLPVRYPSGSSVVLQISETGDRCFVTDYGMGYLESELIGAERTFERHAKTIAESCGINYDGRSFFVAEVQKDRLRGAMVVVADCSQRAASYAALKASERAEREIKDEVFERIGSVFGRNNIDRDIDVRGASSHPWPVSFRVKRDDQFSLFEAVTPYHSSVAAVVAKFHDIGRVEYPPPRIIVARSKRALGDYIGVLAPVSSALLEISASNDDFVRYSIAA